MAKINSLSLNKVKRNPRFVEKQDGINITRVIFPHDIQIGLADASFQSNLTVKGEILGHVHQTAGGISYLVAGTGITITSGSNGQITIDGQVGDITSVVAGNGLTGGGTSGDVTLNIGSGAGITVNADDIAVDADGATLTTSNSDLDHFLINDGGVFKRIAPGNVNISGLNNDSGFTTTNGTVTNVTVGTGLDVSNGTTTPSITLDLSELTDMTADVVGSSDELILLDSSAERRKLISEIKLGQFNNDQGWTSNTGDITGVSAGNGLTGGGTSGDVTLNIGAGTGIDVTADEISVDVSDFMSNGSNNRIVTATGTDAMNAEANLTFDGSTLTVTGDLSVGGVMSFPSAASSEVMIDIVAGDLDASVFHIGRSSSEYGYHLMYSGSGSGNNNSLELITDGLNTGVDVNAVTFRQDGSAQFHQRVTGSSALLSMNSGLTMSQLQLHETADDYARLSFTNNVDTNGSLGAYSHDWTIAGKSAAQTSNSSAILNIFYGDADGDGTGADILTIRGDKKVGINDTSPSYALDVSGDIRATGDLRVDGGDIYGPTDTTLFIRSDHNINIILDNDNDDTRYFLVGNHAGTYKYVISEEGKINQGDASVPKNSYTLRHTNADGDNGLLLVNNNAAVSSGDFLGGVGFDSADGNVPSSILEASAYIGAIAAEDHGTGDKGGHLVFGNSPINQNDDTTSTENMRISSAGNVTAPNNCFVSAYLSTDQSNIAHSSDVTVVFNAETYDTQGAFNTSNGVFTAPADGKYHITAQLRVDNLDSAASYVRTLINTGGSHDVANYFDIDAIANSDPSFSGLFIDTIVHLDANDTAVIQVRQEGGAAQADINGSTAGSSNASRVQIRLVQ